MKSGRSKSRAWGYRRWAIIWVCAIISVFLGQGTGEPALQQDSGQAEMVGLRNGVRVVEAREENGELVGMSLLVRVEEGEGGIGMRQVWARAFALAMEEDGTLEEVIAAGDGVRVRVELKYVLFSLTAPKEKAGGCLAGWGEGVRKPAFTERMVEEAKRESLAGLKAREEDWTGQALMYLGATYNEGRSLHSLEEMEEATKEISLEGVREFHRRLVVPERLVVGIVGESGAEEGIRAAKEAFEGIEGDEGGARKEGGGSPFPWGLGETVAVEENGAGAAYVVLGYSVEGAKDEEWVGLELMGILMRREIEERRLVGREVYGGVTTVPLGIGLSREGLGGTLVVYGVCHPLRMGEAANFMEEWVERWRSMEIGEDELEKAREELRYMTTVRWQSAGMMAEYWGSRGIMASCGRGERIELAGGDKERLEAIGRMDAGGLRELAREFLQGAHAAVVMPERTWQAG